LGFWGFGVLGFWGFGVLFKEIMTKKLTVREAEGLSRRVATERIRNKGKYLDPVMIEMEKNFTESLGTRVRIEKTKEGGTVTIDFFSPDDLRMLLEKLENVKKGATTDAGAALSTTVPAVESVADANALVDDRAPADVQKEENEDLYSLKNFSL
jgi:hypothetical protein